MSKKTPFSLFIRQAQLYPLTAPFLPPIDKVEKDYVYANGALIGTLEAGGGSGLPKTGQENSGHDYDDGYYKAGLPASGDRFTDNGDGTITDNATGLMYIADLSDLPSPFTSGGNQVAMNWGDGLDNINSLDYAGHTDWRMANVLEALAVTNWGNQSPPLDTGIFTYSVADAYWTSTLRGTATTIAVLISFGFGVTLGSTTISQTNYVIPVRGNL